MPQRLSYAALLFLTVLLGAGTRFAALGLPQAVGKYGGSALWAAAIFWLLSLAAPRSKSVSRAGAALAAAWGIEFFKLVHRAALDGFRLTLPGKLLLGRIFSVRDLIAYTVAICLAAALDHTVLRANARLRIR